MVGGQELSLNTREEKSYSQLEGRRVVSWGQEDVPDGSRRGDGQSGVVCSSSAEKQPLLVALFLRASPDSSRAGSACSSCRV